MTGYSAPSKYQALTEVLTFPYCLLEFLIYLSLSTIEWLMYSLREKTGIGEVDC